MKLITNRHSLTTIPQGKFYTMYTVVVGKTQQCCTTFPHSREFKKSWKDMKIQIMILNLFNTGFLQVAENVVSCQCRENYEDFQF